MPGLDLKVKRGFSDRHETNSVMSHDSLELKFFGRRIGYRLQLMLGHGRVGFVIDSVYDAVLFELADDAAEFDDRSSIGIGFRTARRQGRFSHQNFTNEVCHAFRLIVRMRPRQLRRPNKGDRK